MENPRKPIRSPTRGPRETQFRGVEAKWVRVGEEEQRNGANARACEGVAEWSL